MRMTGLKATCSVMMRNNASGFQRFDNQQLLPLPSDRLTSLSFEIICKCWIVFLPSIRPQLNAAAPFAIPDRAIPRRSQKALCYLVSMRAPQPILLEVINAERNGRGADFG